MIALTAKRIGAAVVIVVVLTAALFLLQAASHTSPVHALLGAGASKAAVQAETNKLGLNHPLVVQYLHYIGHLVQGNLGTSYRTRRAVITDLRQYLPATIELSLAGLGLALFLGAVLGLAGAGRWRGSGVFRFVLLCGSSTPPFLLALLGILFLSGRLGWLPAIGQTGSANAPTGPTGLLLLDSLIGGRLGVFADALRHLILPATCIALVPAVSIGRILRSSLETTMVADHVRTARAKGLKERTVIVRHALRNSLGPALSMTGLQAGLMFAGVVVIEEIFAWPGVGNYVAQSIPQGDFPAIAGVTLVLSVAYVAINTLVDILQAVADPRLKP